MSNTGSFKPSNSGVAGIRPKRNDWRTKTRQAILDYGRKKKSRHGGFFVKDNTTSDGTSIPGLGAGPKRFLERIIGK